MASRKCSESSETISFIQPESQPANAVPPMFESVCESVESEADPLNYFNVAINFASVKFFSWLRH